MQIPETPRTIQDLDLMKRLQDYSTGDATWFENEQEIGPNSRQACNILYSDLVRLTKDVFNPILSRTTTREMEMFTMHDSTHARKVAHLMWHILESKKREHLTPPEISLMVSAAYFHDLGMALSSESRTNLLSPGLDLWERLELEESQKLVFENLNEIISNPNSTSAERTRANLQIHQSEEALLCLYVREMHATQKRYQELINELLSFHENEPTGIPNLNTSLSFEGEPFLNVLTDICESHRGDVEVLLQLDGSGSGRPRYPRDYPIGSCNADLQLVAASLRLADVLDFDRERTPIVLFHFLLPSTLGFEHRSVVEWKKHLAISNWHINQDAIIFRGRCDSHIIHHAIVQFCEVIREEITSVKSTFVAMNGGIWPFILPSIVKSDIHEEGYRYIPYRFELDDERVYELFMGGSIYHNPLDAVRELIQNSIDACKLRDNVTRLHEPHIVPNTENRITIYYHEPTDTSIYPKLIVKDSGMGMDALILERFFLKVGRSYYKSSEFRKMRIRLNKSELRNLDFAPVSEFGIGFLSSFLISDHVKVKTSIWEPLHGEDTKLRTLWIDGPTRLIRLEVNENSGPGRFKGTEITLTLSRGGRSNNSKPPTWKEIVNYLKYICQDLPYTLNLEFKTGEGNYSYDIIEPSPLDIPLPSHVKDLYFRIPIDDEESSLQGEIAIINHFISRKLDQELAEESPIIALSNEPMSPRNQLLRGGFVIDSVPGIPSLVYTDNSYAKLRFNWKLNTKQEYPTPLLSRHGLANSKLLKDQIIRLWLSYLLNNVDELPEGIMFGLACFGLTIDNLGEWIQNFNSYTLYRLGIQGWKYYLDTSSDTENQIEIWESGEGDSLSFDIASNLLYKFILGLVLPSVTTLQASITGRFYVQPPDSNWKEDLENCYDFYNSPKKWGHFAEYIDDINNLLFYKWPNTYPLNSLYKDRVLNSFEEDEIVILVRLLEKLFNSRKGTLSPVKLNEIQIEIFNRALNSLGDLQFGNYENIWHIEDFGVSDIS